MDAIVFERFALSSSQADRTFHAATVRDFAERHSAEYSDRLCWSRRSMKVKTYKHESLQEGLENIKRDLGGEALILSTRSVAVRPRFGLFKKQGWEITAAVEERSAASSVALDPLPA